MKRLIFIFFLLPICAFAQNKEFDKLIDKYDVIKYIQNLDNSKPELFWDAVWKNNDNLSSLYKACDKGTEPAVKAKKELYDASLLSERYNRNLQYYKNVEHITDTIVFHSGVGEIFPGATLCIISSDFANAFATPDGKVFFTDSLVILLESDYVKLLGTYAHEASHFILQHSLGRAYATQKKHRKNQIIAGIAAGVNAGANAYAQSNGVTNKSSWEQVDNMTNSLFEAAHDDAFNRYRYKYSREQEIEADIIAYRFVEWIGLGGEAYIDVIKSLGVEEDKYYSRESDHPTVEYRISLLKYLSSKK